MLYIRAGPFFGFWAIAIEYRPKQKTHHNVVSFLFRLQFYVEIAVAFKLNIHICLHLRVGIRLSIFSISMDGCIGVSFHISHRVDISFGTVGAILTTIIRHTYPESQRSGNGKRNKYVHNPGAKP